MTIARVLGNVWATRKHKGLQGLKLLLVQNLDFQSNGPSGEILLAVDQQLGAGVGDTVLLVDEGSAARQILKDSSAPVRFIVCGIVDSVKINKNNIKFH